MEFFPLALAIAVTLSATSVTQSRQSSEPTYTRRVSQCHAAREAYVILTCDQTEMMNIVRAFHGAHTAVGSERTTRLTTTQSWRQRPYQTGHRAGHRENGCQHDWDDCTHTSIDSLYRLSDCQGVYYCYLELVPAFIPHCGQWSQYLQVEYQCIKRTRVHSVCSSTSSHTELTGHVTSLSYPSHYEADLNCRCSFRLPRDVDVSFKVFHLLVGGEGCHGDRLLLYNDAYQVPVCQTIFPGQGRTIRVSGQIVYLHFISDSRKASARTYPDGRSHALRGFWLQYYVVSPNATLEVTCQPWSLPPPILPVRHLAVQQGPVPLVAGTPPTPRYKTSVPTIPTKHYNSDYLDIEDLVYLESDSETGSETGIFDALSGEASLNNCHNLAIVLTCFVINCISL